MKISDCWNCGYLCYLKGRYYCLWYKTHPKAIDLVFGKDDEEEQDIHRH